MAETVYKDIPDLNSATLPLVGTEYIEVSATGATGKALWSGIFGSGWWNWLKAAFSAFKAPDSDHADNADTLGAGLETTTDFHDAAQLVGAVPLANIPAELTGKNAATATNAFAVDGYSAGLGVGLLQPYRGYLHGTYTGAQIYAALAAVLPSTNNEIPVNGQCSTLTPGARYDIFNISLAKKTSSTEITLYCNYIFLSLVSSDRNLVTNTTIVLSSSSSTSYEISITY